MGIHFKEKFFLPFFYSLRCFHSTQDTPTFIVRLKSLTDAEYRLPLQLPYLRVRHSLSLFPSISHNHTCVTWPTVLHCSDMDACCVLTLSGPHWCYNDHCGTSCFLQQVLQPTATRTTRKSIFPLFFASPQTTRRWGGTSCPIPSVTASDSHLSTLTPEMPRLTNISVPLSSQGFTTGKPLRRSQTLDTQVWKHWSKHHLCLNWGHQEMWFCRQLGSA